MDRAFIGISVYLNYNCFRTAATLKLFKKNNDQLIQNHCRFMLFFIKLHDLKYYNNNNNNNNNNNDNSCH